MGRFLPISFFIFKLQKNHSRIFVVDDARTVTHEEIMTMAAEAEKEENESS